eukprot:6055502-Karenia_brevis.AAC.1
MVASAISDLAGHQQPLPPLARSLMQLPLRQGGLSLRSLQDLAPFAFVASWALCLHRVLRVPGIPTNFLDLPTASGAQLR